MDIFNIMSTIIKIGNEITTNYDMDFMIMMAKEEHENDTRRLNLYKKYINEQMPDCTVLQFKTGHGSTKQLVCKKEYEPYFVSLLYLKDNPLYNPLYMGKNWETKSRF